jgi:sporulation protein YlmC with PRC-barrel domain
MTIDNIRLRNEFINTQVITRNTGKKLGVVKEVLVDIDQREIVAFGLRDNLLSLSGMPDYMYLNSISQAGDVVLVEDENVFETVDLDAYTPLVNSEVITETGEPLGRVRDFQFNLDDGKVSSIIIASLGYPQIPDQLISTYELSMEEVISSGPNRLIVFEGAEERLTQLTVGVLERLGIGRPAWEKQEEEMNNLSQKMKVEERKLVGNIPEIGDKFGDYGGYIDLTENLVPYNVHREYWLLNRLNFCVRLCVSIPMCLMR